MLPVIILPAASHDIASAIHYYNEARSGRGELFRMELDRTIGIIGLWPDAYELVTERLHRATVRHFSDVVVYRQFPEFIRVVGVISSRRDPALLGSLDQP